MNIIKKIDILLINEKMKIYNKDDDSKYRYCLDEKKGNCPYVFFNEYGVACCGIDKICQVEHYGCIPQKAKNKKRLKQAKKNL